jgi:hypothetical protein
LVAVYGCVEHMTQVKEALGAVDTEAARPALFVPLYGDPFFRFARGTKTVEIRQRKGPWNPGQVRVGRRVRLRRGYSTPDELHGTIRRVAFVDSYWDLPSWATLGADLGDPPRFFDRYAPLVAIEIPDAYPPRSPSTAEAAASEPVSS